MTLREAVRRRVNIPACPRCGSRVYVEEHAIADTTWNWWLCRSCSMVWDNQPKQAEGRK